MGAWCKVGDLHTSVAETVLLKKLQEKRTVVPVQG